MFIVANTMDIVVNAQAQASVNIPNGSSIYLDLPTFVTLMST